MICFSPWWISMWRNSSFFQDLLYQTQPLSIFEVFIHMVVAPCINQVINIEASYQKISTFMFLVKYGLKFTSCEANAQEIEIAIHPRVWISRSLLELIECLVLLIYIVFLAKCPKPWGCRKYTSSSKPFKKAHLRSNCFTSLHFWAAKARNIQMSNLTIGAKVSSQSTLYLWKKLLATSFALCLSTVRSALHLVS